MRRWFIAIVIFLLIIAGAWFALRKKPLKRPVFKTVAAKVGPLRVTVESTGSVQSNLDVPIKCQASGEIIKLPYDISDYVKKGAVIVQIDPKLEKWAVESAQASLSAAEAGLEQAKENVLIAQSNLITTRQQDLANLANAQVAARNAATAAHRDQVLLQEKLGSQATYDTAQTASEKAADDLATARIAIEQLKAEAMNIKYLQQAVTLAQASVDDDRVRRDEAREQYSYTTVKAPISGVVSARTAQVGQVISSAITNVGGGDTAMTISDLSRIFVMASVDESDIGNVKLGQAVQITADAYPGVLFRGKVVQIGVTGQSVSNVVTFNVKIEVLGKNKSLLKPTMTANTRIICAYKKSVLQVPFEAVATKGRRHYVFVSTGGHLHPQKVAVGLTNGEQWQITAGLKAGQQVVAHASTGQGIWSKGATVITPHGHGPGR